MEISSDPYEQKLYHMFKSHDTECLGTLDETSLMKLCSSLELNDQGNALINSLIRDSKSRVSFKAFKEALLTFLGTEMENVDKGDSDIMNQEKVCVKSGDILFINKTQSKFEDLKYKVNYASQPLSHLTSRNFHQVPVTGLANSQ